MSFVSTLSTSRACLVRFCRCCTRLSHLIISSAWEADAARSSSSAGLISSKLMPPEPSESIFSNVLSTSARSACHPILRTPNRNSARWISPLPLWSQERMSSSSLALASSLPKWASVVWSDLRPASRASSFSASSDVSTISALRWARWRRSTFSSLPDASSSARLSAASLASDSMSCSVFVISASSTWPACTLPIVSKRMSIVLVSATNLSLRTPPRNSGLYTTSVPELDVLAHSLTIAGSFALTTISKSPS
mmetsp:Transcript_48294/g.133859  ORF Transcript_48294/g.133859 Transcript_48294/m.133859 type:complete len:252 (-) Transcript_48294:698-1453(-)